MSRAALRRFALVACALAAAVPWRPAPAAAQAADTTYADSAAFADTLDIPVPGAEPVRELVPAPAVDSLAPPPPVAPAPPPESRAGFGFAARTLASDLGYVASSPARMRFRDVAKVLGIAGVAATLFVYDDDLYRNFQKSRGDPAYDAVSDVASVLRPAGLMVITTPVFALGALAGKAFDSKPLERVSLDMIETHLISAALRNSVKYFIGRHKPDEGYGPRYFHFGGRSTPSGHASTAFEMATVISMHANTWPVTVATYGLATLVALERIEAGAHWPSDVYLGSVAGIAVARAVVRRADQRRSGPEVEIRSRGGSPTVELRQRF